MKVEIAGDLESQALLALKPETDEDKVLLLKLSRLTKRSCIINHRGFEYMDPNVEFLIQTMPRSD